MTEISVRPDRAPAEQAWSEEQASAATPAFQDSALVQWAYEAQQANRIAKSLANTSFVPTSLRGKPNDITAAILAGQELGLPPMATLRSIDVIQGTPALRAHAMRGLLQSKGHEIELVSSTPEQCVMRGRRSGADAWQQVSWDLKRAEALQLLGKSEWKKQPQTMLVARATGEICRLVASDVLFAMPYAAEELDRSELAAPATTAVTRMTSADILGSPAPEPAGPPEIEQANPDGEFPCEDCGPLANHTIAGCPNQSDPGA